MQTLQQGEEDALVPRGTSGVSSFPHIESISEKAAYAWHPALQVLKAALKGRALGRSWRGPPTSKDREEERGLSAGDHAGRARRLPAADPSARRNLRVAAGRAFG